MASSSATRVLAKVFVCLVLYTTHGDAIPCANIFTDSCRMRSSIFGMMMSTEEYCTCGSGTSCSNDWSMTDHVVTTDLTATSNIVNDFMFCGVVHPPVPDCKQGWKSIEMWGQNRIPDKVYFYNCKCPSGDKLVLKKVYMYKYNYHHVFWCSSLMNICAASETCMSVDENDDVEYTCLCGDGKRCYGSLKQCS